MKDDTLLLGQIASVTTPTLKKLTLSKLVDPEGTTTLVGSNSALGKTKCPPTVTGKSVVVTRGGDRKTVTYYDEPVFSTDRCHMIQSLNEKKVLTEYLFLILKDKEEYFNRVSTGNTHSYVTHGFLKELPITVDIPSIEDQEKAWKTYNLLQDYITLNKKEETKIRSIRKFMLKEAMNKNEKHA